MIFRKRDEQAKSNSFVFKINENLDKKKVFIKNDAGDVEYNTAVFNNMNTSVNSSTESCNEEFYSVSDDKVNLHYEDIEIEINSDGDTEVIDYTYSVNKKKIINFLSEYAVDDIPENIGDEYYARKDYKGWTNYVNNYTEKHLEELLNKHIEDVLYEFEDAALEEATLNYEPHNYRADEADNWYTSKGYNAEH